jgi:hypothetical protein
MKLFQLVLLMIALVLIGTSPAKSEWGIPVNLGPPVNTPLLEDMPVVDAGDSILVFYYNSSYSMKISRKVGGSWQTPESLPPPIYDTGLPCYLAHISNGIRLYFSSMDRPGGFGGSDIWYSDLVNGQWSTPQNMGAPVNSSSNDNGFHLINNGMRAYFTSQRSGTRGDHDIWVSDWVSGEWTTPINLEDSINSGFSDQEPTVTEDDQELYLWRVGPGMQEPQIYTARKVNGVWQGAHPAGWPIHWRAHWGDRDPYLLSSGNRLYYSGPEDTTGLGGGDIWYVDRVVGVEEKSGQAVESVKSVKVTPNPFTSFATVPGHSTDRFILYDVSGRRVGVYKGDRIGEGLRAGVYFLRTLEGKAGLARIVKIR